jgi:hypothetical protein
MIIEMVKWSSMYDKDTKVPNAIVDKVNNERETFIKEILEALEKNEFPIARYLGGEG